MIDCNWSSVATLIWWVLSCTVITSLGKRELIVCFSLVCKLCAVYRSLLTFLPGVFLLSLVLWLWIFLDSLSSLEYIRFATTEIVPLDMCIQRRFRWAFVIFQDNIVRIAQTLYPSSILYKSIAGRYRPVRVADGPITARYRFKKNAYWVYVLSDQKTSKIVFSKFPQGRRFATAYFTFRENNYIYFSQY